MFGDNKAWRLVGLGNVGAHGNQLGKLGVGCGRVGVYGWGVRVDVGTAGRVWCERWSWAWGTV